MNTHVLNNNKRYKSNNYSTIEDKIMNLEVLVSITFMSCIIIKKPYSVYKSFFEMLKVHENSMLI